MTPLRLRLTLKFVNESARELVSHAKEQGDLEVVIREVAEMVNNLNTSTGANHSLISGVYALFHQQRTSALPETLIKSPRILESTADPDLVNRNELSSNADEEIAPEIETAATNQHSENLQSSEQRGDDQGRRVEIEVEDALKNFEIQL